MKEYGSRGLRATGVAPHDNVVNASYVRDVVVVVVVSQVRPTTTRGLSSSSSIRAYILLLVANDNRGGTQLQYRWIAERRQAR